MATQAAAAVVGKPVKVIGQVVVVLSGPQKHTVRGVDQIAVRAVRPCDSQHDGSRQHSVLDVPGATLTLCLDRAQLPATLAEMVRSAGLTREVFELLRENLDFPDLQV